jgi:hypothetical protein
MMRGASNPNAAFFRRYIAKETAVVKAGTGAAAYNRGFRETTSNVAVVHVWRVE